MTTEPTPSSDSPKVGYKIKITLLQGIIGAASLAGTTAIPLVVQRFLAPAPAPAASPSPTVSIQATPGTPTEVVPATVQPSPTQDIVPAKDDRGKKKGKKQNDDDD